MTGKDRVAEVAKKIKADSYINVQGDEPFFNPKDIKKLVKISKKNPNKISYVYILTPKGISQKTQLTLSFMKRKMKEYDELKKELKGK